MNRWDAQRELIACARSRLDDYEVYRRNLSDPDTLASLHEDHGKLSRAIEVFSASDPVANMVSKSCKAGDFARCVAYIRGRLDAMILAGQPEADDAKNAVTLLTKMVEEDKAYLDFVRDLERR